MVCLMLTIHETFTPAGDLSRTYLCFEDGVLSLVDDEGSFALPTGALGAVMERFGRPLDRAARLVEVASLPLADGNVLRHARHLARYDVIARDFLVYVTSDREPLCALATTVTGALTHLARAAGPHGHVVPPRAGG
jgi:hypothetical protein